MLHELIEKQAKERPKAKALVFQGRVTPYGELQKKIERWALILASRGIRAGDAYGLVTKNSTEFVIAFFALMRLGAKVVPVNFLLKADEISYIFEDAGVVGVMTQPAFLKNVLEAKKKLPKLRDIIVTGMRGDGREKGNEESSTGVHSFDALMSDSDAFASMDTSLLFRPSSRGSDEVAVLIYTSGTTGKPKGVMLSHRNFLANAEQCLGMVPSLSRQDNFFCLLPMFHTFAWTVCVIIPLYLGCKIVISESLHPFSDVIKQIFQEQVSIFVAVPPIYAALLRVPFWWPMRWINPLRLCIAGASALPIAVQQKFEKKFGVPLLEGYGLTEASPVVTLNPETKRVPGSIGQALPGIQIRILGDSGEDLPTGEVGEICVQGENVMKGYFRQEAASQEAFLDREHRWLRTGDLGYVDTGGYLYISDRKKDLIISKGLNVYPKEIEDLLQAHPAVQEAAVVGIPDKSGDEIIRAFVTLKEGAQADRQELLKLCRSKLATYKCPKDLEIRKELPKNTLGKILKRELRQS